MEGISEIEFKLCRWEEIHKIVSDYLRKNNIVVDSFWEDHVLESNHYKMTLCNEIVGYFSIHESSTITLFNVFNHYANQSQELFAKVKKYESVTNAMIVTGDEFFLSHCIDSFARIEKQAYFAVYTDKEIIKERQKVLQLRLADIDNDHQILKLSGDFLNGEIESIRKGLGFLKIYIAEYNNKVVGFGVIQYGRVIEDVASIGMYVCEEYRCQGIAANILQNLKHIVQNNGFRAFSGCWYYNHNSKKSMESAGAYSKTRLIRFYF
ncbi:GNAT family N-acetyltransferase [Tissierella sp.]|uniref:GNAT family N-acetyltransferase n=1 Tax=Tissierella sp. TaxID=41274 RepID=UPI0028598F40|nr:GNAT family N-acetyltransferase [Tissierella sp.]MDR7856595.1 GNAT family N-acetyltransferase [Tissierella sp.]